MIRAMTGTACLALALAMPVQEAAAQEGLIGGALVFNGAQEQRFGFIELRLICVKIRQGVKRRGEGRIRGAIGRLHHIERAPVSRLGFGPSLGGYLLDVMQTFGDFLSEALLGGFQLVYVDCLRV